VLLAWFSRCGRSQGVLKGVPGTIQGFPQNKGVIFGTRERSRKTKEIVLASRKNKGLSRSAFYLIIVKRDPISIVTNSGPPTRHFREIYIQSGIRRLRSFRGFCGLDNREAMERCVMR